MTTPIDIWSSRFDPADTGGFYESYFQRANHPSRPLAFWIRYTVFSPAGGADSAIGELWAVYFDGEQGRQVAAKAELPIAQCRFDRERLGVRIGDAVLEDGLLAGRAQSRGHSLEWDLRYDGGQPPLFLLPERLYDARLPRAKSLVGVPMASFSGRLRVDGSDIDIDAWPGSQNHNWGSRHTDQYAYGQVCGFDNAPESFLEIATGRIRLGRIWSPWMTPLVLRHEGREYAMNSLAQSIIGARASYGFFHWDFRSAAGGVRIRGHIRSSPERFVGLRYYNPPGGEKHCLNSKIASCRLELEGVEGAPRVLESSHRAAFEILTDERNHGIGIAA